MNFSKHVKIAKSFGAGMYAEDVVQEAYLKCIRNNNLAEGYIILAIRSVAFDLYRANKKVKKVELHDNLITEDEPIETHPTKYIEIEHLLDGVHWYDKEVFRIYCQEIKSIRKLAKATEISERTIWKSINICKQKLKENQKELGTPLHQ